MPVTGFIWLAVLALVLSDVTLMILCARLLGVSFWRMLVVTNGAAGTFLIRGPRAGIAEMKAFADERLSRCP